MGWWSEQGKDTELLIGDGPLDAVDDILDGFVALYQEEVGRKPLVEELAGTLEIALSARLQEVFSGVDEKELSQVRLLLRKRATKQAYVRGDYVAVPLPSGKVFGLAKVKDIYHDLLLVELIDKMMSAAPRNIEELAKAPVWEEVLCSSRGLDAGNWSIINRSKIAEPEEDRSGTATRADFDEHFYRLGGTFYGHEAVASGSFATI